MKEIIKQIEKLVDEFMQEFNCYNPNRIIFPLKIQNKEFIELKYKLQNMIKELFQNRYCENCKHCLIEENDIDKDEEEYCEESVVDTEWLYKHKHNFYCSLWRQRND